MMLLTWLLLLPQDAAAPGELRSSSTIHSIGVEWDLAGDANRNAACRVRVRAAGAEAWKPAMPLFRVVSNGFYADRKADRTYNMLAGSLLFLEPGTRYEVHLELSDPDGGAEVRTVAGETRPVPALPTGGRTFHVTPGAGGGEGSEKDPFRGLEAAQAAARAGDVFLLRKGDYGGFSFSRSGEKGRYVAWRGPGDGEAVLAWAQVASSHVWLEGLTFRKADRDTALRGSGPATDVVLARNGFTGFRDSIIAGRESSAWHIADNVVEGRNGPGSGIQSAEGEGIDLTGSGGHVVCYNRVSKVQAGVHYPRSNCDIYGNDIFDCTDDGLEPDYGYANIRMWGNRIANIGANALSFQPMYCGPWYFVRNQVITPGNMFKFRVQDRFLLAHNTFVTWRYMDTRMHCLLSALSRNNLFISAGGKDPVWVSFNYKEDDPRYTVRIGNFKPDWMTDVDYDGFDWGASRSAFRWLGDHPDLASFSRAVGIEKHGIRVRKEEIFEAWDLPAEPGRVGPKVLALRKGSNAVDAGALLPGINDDFAGKAPDLGAHEHGKPAADYGPRP